MTDHVTGNAAKISFIGFGEAGGILTRGLKDAGATITAAYDILIHDEAHAPAMRDKADQIGITLANSTEEAVQGADVVFSAVVTNETLVAAENAAPHLKPGQFYLDINSTSPAKKRKAAAVVEAGGAYYVEAAVMDLFPPKGIATPMLLAGAKAQELADLLTEFGMDQRVVGAKIGDASSLKMVRSVFMKGFTAILIESLYAAKQLEAEDIVIESLQGTFPQINWQELCDYYAPRLVNHAKRQGVEMLSVAETLEELGVEPITTLASAARLGWLGDMDLKNELDAPPETISELLEILKSREAGS
jgi:3-hydroxyisobutyrate dehydrogenase-like beta-hydroxyacid dehydrogenase